MDWFDELQRVTTDTENALAIRRAHGEVDVARPRAPFRCRRSCCTRRATRWRRSTRGACWPLIPGSRLVPLEIRNHILLDGEPAWRRFRDELQAFLDPAA
jgi:hypothetical protein